MVDPISSTSTRAEHDSGKHKVRPGRSQPISKQKHDRAEASIALIATAIPTVSITREGYFGAKIDFMWIPIFTPDTWNNLPTGSAFLLLIYIKKDTKEDA